MAPDLTYGQELVGMDFNPSGNATIADTKRIFADRIDTMDILRKTSKSPVVGRLCSIAITEMEQACMWTVKALAIAAKGESEGSNS